MSKRGFDRGINPHDGSRRRLKTQVHKNKKYDKKRERQKSKRLVREDEC